MVDAFFVGGYGAIAPLTSLVLLLPGLAVAVRRLHDSGRSGWWLLIALVPLLGALYLIWLMVRPSALGSNRYGAAPAFAAFASSLVSVVLLVSREAKS